MTLRLTEKGQVVARFLKLEDDLASALARVRELEAFVAAWDAFDHHACCGCADCDEDISLWRRHQNEHENKVDEARAAIAKAKNQ